MSEKIINNIVDEGARLLFDRNRQLPLQLRRRNQQLSGLKCENPEIGDWIKRLPELSLLIEILNSPDEYFNKRFPSKKPFILEHRQSLAKEIEKHIKACNFCGLVIENENLWKEDVEENFADYRNSLKDSSKDEEEISEPEHEPEISIRVPFKGKLDLVS